MLTRDPPNRSILCHETSLTPVLVHHRLETSRDRGRRFEAIVSYVKRDDKLHVARSVT